MNKRYIWLLVLGALFGAAATVVARWESEPGVYTSPFWLSGGLTVIGLTLMVIALVRGIEGWNR
jgi:hypothetical protein